MAVPAKVVKFVGAWQLSHGADDGTCLAGCPGACTLSWQLTQLPVIPACAKRDARHGSIGRWQLLHSAVVGMWVVGLPIDCTLLWQELQVPTTFMWLKFATGFHANGVWHWLQSVLETMCETGFAVAPMRAPGVWQALHSCGVPLKMPPTWHEAQGALRCWPTSSKPVVK